MEKPPDVERAFSYPEPSRIESEPLRQLLNVAIARMLDSPKWGRWQYEYLGQTDDR